MGSHPFPLGAMQLTSPLPSPSAIPEHASTSMGGNHNANESGSSSSNSNNNNNGGDTDMLLNNNNQYHATTSSNGGHRNQNSSSSSSDDKDDQVIPYPDAMARFKPTTATTTTITTTTTTTTSPGDLPTPTTRRGPSIQRLPLIFNAPNGDDNIYPLARTPTPLRLQRIPFTCQAIQGVFEETVLADDSLAVQVSAQRRTNQSPRKRLVSWFSSEEDWDNVARSSKRTETVSSSTPSHKINPMDQVQEDQHMAAGAASFVPSSSSSSVGNNNHHHHHSSSSGYATTSNTTTPGDATTTATTMENLGVMDSPNSALPSPSLSPVSALATDDDLWPTPSNSSPTHMEEEETIPNGEGNNIDTHSTTTTYTNNNNDNNALIPSTSLCTNDILDTYTQLPNDNVRQYLLLHLLRRSNKTTLRLAHSAINDVLRTDIVGRLPSHLQRRILSFLDVPVLCRCLAVSRQWRQIIDEDAELWRLKIEDAGYQITQEEKVEQQHEEMMNRGAYGYKRIYQRHLRIQSNWQHNRAHRMQLAGHSSHVVTCLQFDEDKIITASDDQTANLYDIRTGRLVRTFYGHEGGVWALQYVGNTLVTGATDRTIRVWDIDTGICRHVFHGHSGTVRCLTIVMPIKNPSTGRYEPQQPLIVSGSRDHSVRVWDLPQSTDITTTTTTISSVQHKEDATTSTTNNDPYRLRRSRIKEKRGSAMSRVFRHIPHDETAAAIVPDTADLPMTTTTTSSSSSSSSSEKTIHVHVLLGHRDAVRALAAHGNTLVSGSYDGSVRIWHLEQGRCLHQLSGHTSKVYSVVIDPKRNRCISGSMDSYVRIWNMETGACEHVLGGHTALVGLLGLSSSHLVSAAADQSLRVWSPETGDRQHILLGHEGAITSFQHDNHKVISGSDGGIKMWDIKTGKLMHNLVNNVSGVWRVAFDERRCIAAVKGDDDVTRLEVFDYDVY